MITEAMLAELHGELPEKLQLAYGKPLMISISYKGDDGKIQHWMGRNNEFSWEDTEKTVSHYVEQVKKDFKPRNLEVIQAFNEQVRVRKRPTLRG